MDIEAIEFPASRGTCPFAPPAALSGIRRNNPVSRVRLGEGSHTWVVTRIADVRAVLRDKRFSSSTHHDGFPWVNEGLKAQSADDPQPFIRLDGEAHCRIRNRLLADFTPQRAESLRRRIQDIVDDCLDRMIERGSPADLVAELALPLPSLIICEMLGVDPADRRFFQSRSALLTQTHGEAGLLQQALDELVGYLDRLARRKRDDPDDTIVSRLAADGDLSAEEVAVTSMFLLIAGHETTANQIAMSTLALLRNPVQLAALRAEPTLIAAATEELLRYTTIVHTGAPRVAIEDVTVGGQLINAGEGVLCALDTANHDEDVFATPGQLNLARSGRSHVAFGHGVHQCLGQFLARVELQVALDSLLRRLPTLDLSIPFEELRFDEGGGVYGLKELPVAWVG